MDETNWFEGVSVCCAQGTYMSMIFGGEWAISIGNPGCQIEQCMNIRFILAEEGYDLPATYFISLIPFSKSNIYTD